MTADPDLPARCLALAQENEGLKKENKRLREALMELAIHPEDQGSVMIGNFRDFYQDSCNFAASALEEARRRVYAIPLPTHAEFLAAALELPEIKALVDGFRLVIFQLEASALTAAPAKRTIIRGFAEEARHTLAELEPK